jgi:cytochrome b subunit of formate dehydrogenase
MCGGCHAENAPVAKSRNIQQHNILQNYEQSIHAEGLLQKGLTVTAMCTSCHTAHSVLPHTDPRSTIYRDNIVHTCTKCHALIEEVHRKRINGALWEAEPDRVPICIDCHQPHKTRRVFYDEGVSDRDCLACHAKEVQAADRVLAAVNVDELSKSTHTTVRCAQCHTGTEPRRVRSCETVIAAVDCSICHVVQVDQYKRSIHGQLLAKNDPDAPTCKDCHGEHGTQSRLDSASPTFAKNIPELCGRCHREGEPAAVRREHIAQLVPNVHLEQEVVEHYTESIHGKGLLKSGLVVTATCTSCHTAHMPLPKSDPESSVNPAHIADTCGRCHNGVEETFLKSVHSPLVTHTDKPLPVCNGCHTAHTISRTDAESFRLNVMQTCGHCHEDVAATYFDTYHGKVSKLGFTKTAKCYDCHGAHDILPNWNPRSHLSRQNIVKTCGQCHPGSNRRFAGYLTHATHHEPHKYPALFFVFWAMTGLLVGTFGFFGLHTLAWLPRSLAYSRQLRREHATESAQHVRRFPTLYRNLHLMVIVSFLGLALTGMTLKFSYTPWAYGLSRLFGGFEAAGFIHRVCAAITFAYFFLHLRDMVRRKTKARVSWWKFLAGPSGMLPGKRDLVEFWQSLKWFVGRGPRPQYGRWTYWEKFDYFAVFWGVAMIGSTGLVLWFPTLFTRLMPGIFINIATIIHSDEALLAVGFIFTVHFFNTHFRPEKFPMDPVIFTGTVPLDEFKQDRPREYEELEASGELEARLEAAPPPRTVRAWRIFGSVALSLGILLVLLIVYAAVFGYR